jgi:D-amino-acid dehydrogenase
MPGAIGMALRSLLSRRSPFAIKPRLDVSLWSWLFHFARRCNRRDMMTAARSIQALLDSSRRLYDELLAQEPIDCEWEARGLLFVLRTPTGMEHASHAARMLHEQFGLACQRFDGASLSELEPALLPGLAGGWLYTGDAHLRPDRLMASWRSVLKSRGVQIREYCPVSAFAAEQGKARAVVTPAGLLEAEAFVVATGAWTPGLARQLGCPVPIQPGKGYSITMPRPRLCPSHPLVLEEHRVAVTPMRSGYRIGSTMEFAGYDTSLNRTRLELLRDAARLYLHEPFAEPVLEEWFGWRPMTYDSKPIIDRSPRLGNVLIAAGHSMLGVSMAPGTGKLVAELLSGDRPHIDPAPFTVARF